MSRRNRDYQKETAAYEWKSADGTIYNMYDMEESHIDGCIQICKTYRSRYGSYQTKLDQLTKVKKERENGKVDPHSWAPGSGKDFLR